MKDESIYKTADQLKSHLTEDQLKEDPDLFKRGYVQCDENKFYEHGDRNFHINNLLAEENDKCRIRIITGNSPRWDKPDKSLDDNIFYFRNRTNHQTALTASVFHSQYKKWIINAVKEFKDFDPDVPEHDSGTFEVGDQKWMFKFDYFDDSWTWGWDRDSMPTNRINRILTIMSARDY